MSFEQCIGPLLGKEGGYTNDPRDPGGETNWGVTIAVARAFGYLGAMQSMTRDQAVEVYRRRYWKPLLLDDVAAMSPKIADELFDQAVNQGVETAGRALQRALNVLNKGGTFYPDVTVDGRVGPMTIAALKEYARRRGNDGETVLLRALNALQATRYIEIAENRTTSEDYVFGWILNRVS